MNLFWHDHLMANFDFHAMPWSLYSVVNVLIQVPILDQASIVSTVERRSVALGALWTYAPGRI